MNNLITMKSKRGRTAKEINWPLTSEFTIRDVAAINTNLSKVTIAVRMNQEVESQKLRRVGQVKGSRGRGQVTYALVN